MNKPDALQIVSRTAAILAAGYILLWLYIALSRIAYPYELEWMEGAMVDAIARVMNGQPLYVAPSIEFVPAIYTPLYVYLSAGLSKIIGLGFFAPRLISFISTMGCLALIFCYVRRETKDLWLGITGAGLFAATFRLGGAWFDIARVDMLFLAFVLGTIYLMRFHRTAKGYLSAGILLAIAFWTKQSALLLFLPLLLYALIYERKLAWIFAAAAITTTVPLVLLWNSASDGWFLYYTFKLPSQHGIWKGYIIDFVKMLIKWLPAASLAAAYLIISRWKRKDIRELVFLLCAGAGLFLVSLTCRAKLGGYDNCLIPFFASLAFVLPLALREMRDLLSPKLQTGLWIIVLLQFVSFHYDPSRQIPTAADRKAGDNLIETIRRAHGQVYFLFHGYLNTLAGKKSYAHAMAVHDILISKDEKMKSDIREMYDRAFRDSLFDYVVMDNRELSTIGWNEIDFSKHFLPQRTLFADKDLYWPVTGMRTRPEALLARIRDN